jgi:hypothetical protein
VRPVPRVPARACAFVRASPCVPACACKLACGRVRSCVRYSAFVRAHASMLCALACACVSVRVRACASAMHGGRVRCGVPRCAWRRRGGGAGREHPRRAVVARPVGLERRGAVVREPRLRVHPGESPDSMPPPPCRRAAVPPCRRAAVQACMQVHRATRCGQPRAVGGGAQRATAQHVAWNHAAGQRRTHVRSFGLPRVVLAERGVLSCEARLFVCLHVACLFVCSFACACLFVCSLVG